MSQAVDRFPAHPSEERSTARLASSTDSSGLPLGLTVGLVGPLPPPAGGMANQAALLRDRWRGEGIRLEVVRTNAPYRPAWIARLRVIRAAFRLLPYLTGLWRAAGRCDVFHVLANSGWSWFLFAWPALLIGRMRGISVVINYRGGEADAFLSRWGRLVIPSLNRAAAVIVPSGYLQQVFRRYGIRCSVIPNVVEPEQFAWRRPSAYVPSAPRLLVARNLERIYGVDLALLAFRKVLEQFPDAMLEVAGTGAQHHELLDYAERLGIARHVHFLGALDRAEIAARYAQADVLLNASRVDNMPNALLEALASGLPVVSSDAGGIPYMVQHDDTALLVPVESPDALAAAAVRVLSDRSLAQALAERGRRTVEACSWGRVRGQWRDAYLRARNNPTGDNP